MGFLYPKSFSLLPGGFKNYETALRKEEAANSGRKTRRDRCEKW